MTPSQPASSGASQAASPAPSQGAAPASSRAAPVRIAIVGGGFSGTMVAVHLHRALGGGAAIELFDRSGSFANGPAYAAEQAANRLNVRAKNMSAFPDDAEHFDRWAAERTADAPDEVQRTTAGDFVTRRLYGAYLQHLLAAEMAGETTGEAGGGIRRIGTEVTRIDRAGHAWRIGGADGSERPAALVVLASGNLASRQPADGVVFHNPWSPDALQGVRPDAPVMIVGTALTMVDLVLALRDGGFRGPIVALSRRGLLPQSHRGVQGAWPAAAFTEAERRSALALLRRVRREVRDAAAQGIDWRAVIDGLRPVTTPLWQGLPPTEQRRLLRHVRPFWDSHRHRMPQPSAEELAAMRAGGGLRLLAGRIRAVERVGDGARVSVDGKDGRRETLTVQRLIYATGPRGADGADPLLDRLYAEGTAAADAHRLGVRVDAGLHVLAADGAANPTLWALGPVVRGELWECTSVPDIRVQARRVADAIVARVTAAAGHEPPTPVR